ncbi:helix-turn-helix domain-containing protein [Flavobacterium algicola]|uniref:helix-turn-helix domain-containing protein n=1 Tax=Flavobacterium algicola TaxID=556529 RepID=UPI001EFC3070|nr:AraC family transcriptional regulator [Flavobacterium algicola]MCG9791610.1 AraC family transcriptional regulator [Flavobacterium algicola]
MKITSKIRTTQKPIFEITTENQNITNNSFLEENVCSDEVEDEYLITSSLVSRNLVLLDIELFFEYPKTIDFNVTGESVLLNFICCNNVKCAIENFEGEMYEVENTQNIIYAVDFSGQYDVPAFEQIKYFTIILSAEYYAELINKNWNLHPKFSKDILRKINTTLSPNYLPFNPAIQWVIHEIKNCKYEGAMKKMYIETKVKELVVLQIESLLNTIDEKLIVDSDDYDKLHEAKLILENNFTNAPTLPELSRIIALNEFKLKKGFKACFQTTVKGYITKLRMEYAKNLFRNKTLNVGEVAEKCGYKDVSHFSSAFKLFYGFTPVSFRKNHLSLKYAFLYCDLLDVFSLDLFLM